MPTYDHLPLRRIEGELFRRKHGSGRPPVRIPGEHGPRIQTELETVVEAQRARPQIGDIDPALIMKIKTASPIDETDWARVGLTILASDPDKTLVLFANDKELTEFRRRVEAYQQEPPADQRGPQYDGFVGAIDYVDTPNAQDRIGPTFLSAGILEPAQFVDGEQKIIDVELWKPNDDQSDIFIFRLTTKVVELGGRVLSEYRGNSITLVRVEGDGALIRAILELPEVAVIDLPPSPDIPPADVANITMEDLDQIQPPPADAMTIGIVDSGVTSGHPFLRAAVGGSFGATNALGDNDDRGHGTAVSGIAVYGDLRQRLATNQIAAQFRIASAKVVGADGMFDNVELVPAQMDQSIRRLHGEFGCRVINISLGDARRAVRTKPSAWAAVLDGLARELDLIVVVPCGNLSRNLVNIYGDGVIAAYPAFLLDDSNRILEPASAINALTVGSIAHGNGLDDIDLDTVGVRPLTQVGQPSPFTRVGPGVRQMMKPDFVDYGGTAVFDGVTQALVGGNLRSSAGILSLNNRYVERLFSSGSGTSFACPLVAYKAALLLRAFPGASANLIRSLLALSAEVPPEAAACLDRCDEDQIGQIVGNGVINIERALNSEDNRVVLIREDTLGIDRFAVYEIPIPEEFQITNGVREIRVALSFDPPVRHTRLDYAGVSMGFHLMRGTTTEDVFNHFRRWERRTEGTPFRLPSNLACPMTPGPQRRERGTLQRATFTAQRNIAHYGDRYFLAVRCEGGWASNTVQNQRFAVAVELRHQAQIQLYERVRVRIRA